MPGRLFTVGHSNHTIEELTTLLVQNGVTAIADVRSTPHSSYSPHFNRDPLARSLKARGIAYVYLGAELGARRSDPECFRGNRVDFQRTASTPGFYTGLNRVAEGLKTFNVALMCAEHDPLECHRSALICRHGEYRIGRAKHLRGDGAIESHDQLENRLLELSGQPRDDLFRTREERLDDAWSWLEERIAWRRP